MANGLLSTEQVLLLENLMYLTNKDPLKSVTEMGNGKTIADLVNIDINSLIDSQDYGSYMTGNDWNNIIQTIKSDDTLMDMQIVATHVDNADGGGGGESAVFVNPDTKEAVVLFRGTASNEWKDDFVGGGATNTPDGVSTQQQMNALEWYKELDLNEYDTITVAGHSKGGNKAKYITVMDGSVDRCISFDGQGFSDEFMDKYRDQIAIRQDKITNHNAEYDYVNLLLNDIGDMNYYQGHDFGAGGFLENHCPNTMFQFNDDGTYQMIKVNGRAEEMDKLDEFLNSYLRSLSQDDKQRAMETLGIIVEQGFNNASMDDILSTLLEGNNVDQMAYLLAYLIKYEQDNPEFADAVCGILNTFGMDAFVKVVDIADSIMNWKYFGAVMDILSFAGNNIPEWMLKELSKFLEKNYGIILTTEELNKLLSVIGKINDNLDTIKVVTDGKDIVIQSVDSHSFSIETKTVSDVGEAMRGISKELIDYSGEVSNISMTLDGTKGMRLMRLKMKNIANALADESESMSSMGNGIEQILKRYSDTERRIINSTFECMKKSL